LNKPHSFSLPFRECWYPSYKYRNNPLFDYQNYHNTQSYDIVYLLPSLFIFILQCWRRDFIINEKPYGQKNQNKSIWTKEPEQLTLPDHTSSSTVFSGVRGARSLFFCVMFCRSLFVPLSFFFWPLYCLSFYLRLLITPLASSSCSYQRYLSTMDISSSFVWSFNTIFVLWDVFLNTLKIENFERWSFRCFDGLEHVLCFLVLFFNCMCW
jgi:hypothetical protein